MQTRKSRLSFFSVPIRWDRGQNWSSTLTLNKWHFLTRGKKREGGKCQKTNQLAKAPDAFKYLSSQKCCRRSKQPLFVATNPPDSEIFYCEELDKNTFDTSTSFFTRPSYTSAIENQIPRIWSIYCPKLSPLKTRGGWRRASNTRAARRHLLSVSGIIQGVESKAEPSVSFQCLFFF